MEIIKFGATEAAEQYRYKQNYGNREGVSIDAVILHSVHGNFYEGDRHIAPEEIFFSRGVSPHYFIKRDGTILQFVDEEFAAWHAGKSCFDGRDGWNQSSIGIELESFGDIEALKDLDMSEVPGYHLQSKTVKSQEHKDAFSVEQYISLRRLLDDIYNRYEIKYLLPHSDIAPGRKNDPGEDFDWARLEESGYRCYLNFARARERFSPDLCQGEVRYSLGDSGAGVRVLQGILQALGYDLGVSGVYDEATARVVAAFKLHYAAIGSDYSSWSAGDYAALARLFEFMQPRS
jgi:N-acetylmuramoyl-L-alanine amidase